MLFAFRLILTQCAAIDAGLAYWHHMHGKPGLAAFCLGVAVLCALCALGAPKEDD